jgi:hypothetical protein
MELKNSSNCTILFVMMERMLSEAEEGEVWHFLDDDAKSQS